MAVTYYPSAAGQGFILCLSSDTKPSVPNGMMLTEQDTGKVFLREVGAWVEKMNPAYAEAGQSPGAPAGEAFPVGSIFISAVSTSPTVLLGYGVWTPFGAGRVLVGQNVADPDFDVAEETGGAKTHTLQTANLPAHNHPVTDPGHAHLTQRYPTATGASSGFTIDTSMSGTPADNTLPVKSATTGITIGNTGSGTAVNHMPPYIVAYFWKRTA